MDSAEALNQVSCRAPAVPMRSVRRATARRASSRRTFARGQSSDNEASIIAFLAHHPDCTTGVLAKRLNLDPALVATCLTQLSFSEEIQKTSHGYSTAPELPAWS